MFKTVLNLGKIKNPLDSSGKIEFSEDELYSSLEKNVFTFTFVKETAAWWLLSLFQ